MPIRRPVLLAVGLLGAFMLMGTAGYVLIEGWSPFEALWMVVITLTTIGYGEVQPLSMGGRVFTILLIVGGLSLGTFAMTQLTSAILDGDLRRMVQSRRRRRRVATLNRHYIVVGYGRLGEAVAQELVASGHQVCVVERDVSRLRAAELAGHAVVDGDGSDDDVLRTAGIEHASGLAVASPAGAEAAFVTLSARQLAPQLQIIARVDAPESLQKIRKAGANAVVSPHNMGGWRMAHTLLRPHTTNFVDLATLAAHEDISFDEIAVTQGSLAEGRTLAELKVGLTHQVLVVAIRGTDGRVAAAPPGSHRVEVGQVLIVVGAPARVREFVAAIEGASSGA